MIHGSQLRDSSLELTKLAESSLAQLAGYDASAIRALNTNTGPGVTEDGYGIVWNDTQKEWQLSELNSNSIGAGIGLTLSQGNINLGGSITDSISNILLNSNSRLAIEVGNTIVQDTADFSIARGGYVGAPKLIFPSNSVAGIFVDPFYYASIGSWTNFAGLVRNPGAGSMNILNGISDSGAYIETVNEASGEREGVIIHAENNLLKLAFKVSGFNNTEKGIKITSSGHRGFMMYGFGEASDIDATGADYSSLVSTSLVPKTYVDSSVLFKSTMTFTDGQSDSFVALSSGTVADPTPFGFGMRRQRTVDKKNVFYDNFFIAGTDPNISLSSFFGNKASIPTFYGLIIEDDNNYIFGSGSELLIGSFARMTANGNSIIVSNSDISLKHDLGQEAKIELLNESVLIKAGDLSPSYPFISVNNLNVALSSGTLPGSFSASVYSNRMLISNTQQGIVYDTSTLNTVNWVDGTLIHKAYLEENLKKADVKTHFVPPEDANNYTLVLEDAGKYLRVFNGNATTITIPLNANVAFPIHTVMTIRQADTGQLTMTPEVGVVLNGELSTSGQHNSVQLVKVGTDTWDVEGGVT